MKSFVTVNSDGYIDMWSNQKLEGFAEVETSENIINLINVCKVENGKVILDEKRQKEIISNQRAEKTELDLLRQESADMMIYVAEVEQKTQQDYADLLLSLAEAGAL
ncbi:Uncharacterised protein [Listeria ivanovii subsp. londoniensis]|uniref:Uncharacterized protein n=1 Tax=Listeria ivanovii TaxID=1638 RepID=A0AAX2DTB1_LISIV|nr:MULTISPECIES: hypothetical protein [Listeria]EFR97151.1 gp20 [Listeria ivanovii FSL F6-596]EFS02348.1 gp20 [Listeria seeligeri FSL S4-171]SDX38255.1 hypothetical protein SAMN05421782_11935 [Listeria ivanovii]VEH46023.1 Uncharacterised protein [Listeria ivanovii subsp. londoniensis]